MGIEPTLEAWEAPVLPLNYTRKLEAPSDAIHLMFSDSSAAFGFVQFSYKK